MSRASRLSGFTTAISGDTDLNVGIVTAKQINIDQSFTFTNINVTGVATANNLNVTGVSTLSNVVVGGATTELVVTGDARVTGILTVGTSSLTLNGDSSTITGITTINNISIASSGTYSNRNVFDNGAMKIAQRRTSESGLSNNAKFIFDRWSYRRSGSWGSNSFTMSQETVGAPPEFLFYMRVQQSGTAAAVPSDTAVYVSQGVEKSNMSTLSDGTTGTKECVISWYARGSRPGTYSLCVVKRGDTSESYTTTYSLTTDWQRFTKVIPASLKQWGDTLTSSGKAMDVYFTVAGDGSSSGIGTDTLNSWTGVPVGLVANTQEESFASTSSATFDITGIQLELGNQATPFEHLPHAIELERCRRYCQHFTCGGSGTATGANQTQSAQGTVNYTPEMRDVPTITFGTITSGTNNTGNISAFVPRKTGHVCGAQASSSGRQFWAVGLSTASAEF